MGKLRKMRLQWTALILILLTPLLLGASPARRIIASAGNSEITPKDLSYRLSVEKAYGNRKITMPAAAVLLVNELLEKEVAAAHGVDASEEDIRAFTKYVDENTRAPELLAKVKAVFKADEVSYDRIYLAPRVVNRKLHYFYSRDAGIHREERTQIEKAYGLVVSGKALKEAAAELGLEYQTFSSPEEKKSEMPAELAKYMNSGAKLEDPLLPIVGRLSVGQLYDHIVEDDSGYQVVRLLEKEGDKYSVESVLTKKRPFDEWFMEEAKKIKIRVLDPKIRKKVLAGYPDLWWVRQMMVTGSSKAEGPGQ